MDDTANASRVFRFVVTFLVFREGAFDEADHEKGEEACSEGWRSEGGAFFLPAVCRERCDAPVVELEPALRHRVLVVGVER